MFLPLSFPPTLPLASQAFVFKYPVSIFLKNPWQGAQTTIHCAVTEGIEHQSGLYFADCKVAKVSNPDHKSNEQVAERLWSVSTELVGLEE